MRFKSLAPALMLASLALPPTPVSAADEAGLQCDRLAASVFDQDRPPGIEGVPFDQIDPEKALAACEGALAANPNAPRYQFAYGRALEKASRFGEALAYYSLSANTGMPVAKHALAVMLATGQGDIRIDMTRALKLYEEAAASGISVSMNNLGWIYRNGNGTKADPAKALEWFLKAAEANYNAAATTAAEMLFSGEGTVAAAPEKAAILWRKLAAQGDSDAMAKLGLAIQDGKIAPLSPTEMEEQLTVAAELGNYDAASALSKRFETLKDRPDAKDLAMYYAFMAYKISRDASIGEEAAWLLNQDVMARRIFRLAEEGTKFNGTKEEFAGIKKDFGGPMKKFTVPAKCGSEDFPVDLYIWTWTRPEPQTDLQIQWYDKARGCKIPDDVTDSFRKLYNIAAEHKVDFPELAANALGNTPTKDPVSDKQTDSKTDIPADQPSDVAENEKPDKKSKAAEISNAGQNPDAENNTAETGQPIPARDFTLDHVLRRAEDVFQFTLDRSKLTPEGRKEIEAIKYGLLSMIIWGIAQKENYIPETESENFDVTKLSENELGAIALYISCAADMAVEFGGKAPKNASAEDAKQLLAVYETRLPKQFSLGLYQLLTTSHNLGVKQGKCDPVTLRSQETKVEPPKAASGAIEPGESVDDAIERHAKAIDDFLTLENSRYAAAFPNADVRISGVKLAVKFSAIDRKLLPKIEIDANLVTKQSEALNIFAPYTEKQRQDLAGLLHCVVEKLPTYITVARSGKSGTPKLDEWFLGFSKARTKDDMMRETAGLMSAVLLVATDNGSCKNPAVTEEERRSYKTQEICVLSSQKIVAGHYDLLSEALEQEGKNPGKPFKPRTKAERKEVRRFCSKGQKLASVYLDNQCQNFDTLYTTMVRATANIWQACQ